MNQLIKKKYTLRFRKINRDTFLALKNGKKKVETRAATKKYRHIQKGDVLVFVCGKQRFQRQVKRATVFKTIERMLKQYKIKDINPAIESAKQLQQVYYSFPKYREKIKKYGLIALELS